MSRFQKYCLPGMLLAAVIAAGCAQSPTAPTDSATTATSAGARPSAPNLTPGFYQMLFLHNNVEVATLPAGPNSNLLVKVHVEDSNHVKAGDGSVLFEICRWKGLSPTTGTRRGAAPSLKCEDGSGEARWVKHSDVPINPETGNAFAGFDFVSVACVMGWRVTYRGSQTIAPHVMGPVDFTWYVE